MTNHENLFGSVDSYSAADGPYSRRADSMFLGCTVDIADMHLIEHKLLRLKGFLALTLPMSSSESESSCGALA